jgi:hypothetical protein
MVIATTIYKGKVIAEEEFALSHKRKTRQKKLSEYLTMEQREDE